MKRHSLLHGIVHRLSTRSGHAPWVVLALGVAGCEHYPLHDLGYTVGDATSPSPSVPPEGDPPPVARLASEFVGAWIGFAEDPFALVSNADDDPPPFRFSSGSTRIRLELGMADGALSPRGSIMFGDAPPPELPTDPELGYPVDPPSPVSSALGDTSVRPPVDGFVYSVGTTAAVRDIESAGLEVTEYLFGGQAIDGKLDLTYAPAQVFEPWCALQTAATCPANEGAAWDGAGNCSYGEQGTPMDCLKLSQCLSNVCSCAESGPCAASYERTSSLTLRLSDEGLVGLFSGAVFWNERGAQQPLGTVHFRPASADE